MKTSLYTVDMKHSQSESLVIDKLRQVYLNLSIIDQMLSDQGIPINEQQKKHILELIHLCIRQRNLHDECVANVHIEVEVQRCMEYLKLLKTRTMEMENLEFYDEALRLLQQLRY